MQIIIPVFIALLLFFGCQQLGLHRKNSITGTYIRSGKHEYGIEYDTLVISVQIGPADQYQVIRKWKYQHLLDGQLQQPEYKVTCRSAIYYDNEKSLRLQDGEVWYTFDSDNIIYNGPVQYHKI